MIGIEDFSDQELIEELKGRQYDLTQDCSTDDLRYALVNRKNIESIDVRKWSDIAISIEGKGFDTYDSGKLGCTIIISKDEDL